MKLGKNRKKPVLGGEKEEVEERGPSPEERKKRMLTGTS